MKTIRNGILSLLLLLAGTSGITRAADLFLGFNEFWLYLDNGIDQGTAWRNATFDYYSDWSLGVTEIGFGEGDEFTELNSAPSGVPLNTAYFVTFFDVNNAATYSNLTIRLRRDDGAIVYVNGLEVFRSNMPTGAVNYATKALRNIDGDDEFTFAQRVVPASVLRSGENTIAVEVHQANGGNDDMSFALVLLGHRVGENQPPSAFSSVVSAEQDKSTNITLSATDPDGDPLTFTILSSPQHGALSGEPPNVTYTPEAGYTGPDLFSFSATDGQWNTEVAYVCIEVKVPSNHQPVANSQNLTVPEDNALTITLTATDEDGDALAYSNTSATRGTLTPGPDHTFVYQPAENYFGPDSFSFTVDDGNGGVASAAINITVTPVNDAPVPVAQSLVTDEDTPLVIVLAASDVEGDMLTFSFAQPAHGVVTGSGKHLTYQPTANYNGADSFNFFVDDGNGGTAVATISISVAAVNDAPTAESQNVTTAEDTPMGILVSANDADGDTLTYTYTQPAHGTVNGSGATAIYQPAANYNGPDSFTFTVEDGQGGSATGTINITVTSVNDAPVALAREAAASDPTNFTRDLVLVATNNQNALVLLNASNSSDIDGNALTYAWFLGSSATPFSTEANPTVSLPVGDYALTLVVSDGAVSASDTITAQIFTPCSVVQSLVSRVQMANLKTSERNGLLGHLNAACSTFNNGNVNAGVHQLELFQARVNNKVAPCDASLARALDAEAQHIIHEVSGQ